MKANRFNDAIWKRVPRRPMAVSAAAGALLLSGCGMTTHFHDEKLAALATNLQTEFAAYREDQPSLYTAMRSNVASFAKEEEAVLARFAGNVEAALLTKAPTMTFEQYETRLKLKKNALTDLKTEGSQALREDQEKRYQTLSNIKDLEGAIRKIDKEIDAAEKNEDKWNKTIMDLQDGMAKLPTVLQKLADRNTGIDAIKGAITGTDEDTAGLRKRVIEAAEGKLADAPGIAVRILQLGLELGELKREEAELELAALNERRAVYQDFATSISVATALHTKADKYMAVQTLAKNKKSSPAASVIEENDDYRFERAFNANKRQGRDPRDVEFNEGANATDLQNTLHLHIMVPRLAIGAESLITRQDGLIRLRLARLRHLDSIAESAIGDRANQALIASGIDALVAYHNGGITDEDIANLIRVAQSVALFIIAA